MWAEASSAAAGTKTQLLAVLQKAADATGTDFQYLLDTAKRESGLKTQAKSSTSSASGMFQFVEQTWMGMVKKYGAQYGMGAYANAITQGTDGRYRAASAADRQAILALRNDPQAAALMAGKYAGEAKSSLEGALGRDVCNGELYAAHFLGPDAACRLIKLNQTNPDAAAAVSFPQAANANRSVFYNADGSAKSVREVYGWATRQTHSNIASNGETRTTARLNLRQSVSDEDTGAMSGGSFDALPMMLLNSGRNGLSAIASFGASTPRAPLSLSMDVLNLISSMDRETALNAG